MMDNFTPGPWLLTIQPATPLNISTVAAIEQADGEHYRGMIARCQSAEHICGITAEEMTANARLIAAAPDLLAALEGLAQSPMFAAIEGHAAARAAIAKARGQS
jgi:hypothetical protein